MTKLADEACDLFKVMPKSKAKIRIGLDTSYDDTHRVCVCVVICRALK